jgi:hypothetical protein
MEKIATYGRSDLYSQYAMSARDAGDDGQRTGGDCRAGTVRALSFGYRRFGGIFTLTNEHQKLLAGGPRK